MCLLKVLSMSFYKVVFSMPYGFLDDFEKIESELVRLQIIVHL